MDVYGKTFKIMLLAFSFLVQPSSSSVSFTFEPIISSTVANALLKAMLWDYLILYRLFLYRDLSTILSVHMCMHMIVHVCVLVSGCMLFAVCQGPRILLIRPDTRPEAPYALHYPSLISILPSTSLHYPYTGLTGARLWLQSIHTDGK